MTPPIDHPLDLAMQAILIYASWGLTLVLLVVAARLCVKERTPFYLYVVLASMVGAFAEPLYDAGLMLWFYSPGMWSHFSAFGIPQPLWTHSGYAVLYGSAAVYACWRIHHGRLSRSGLYACAGLELALSCIFEMTGINGGAYEYWGPHVFRIFQYPVIIGILEATQVTCFAVAAAQLRRHSGPAGLLALFAIFPATFFLANFGGGAPAIVALHLDAPSRALVYAGTVLSIVIAAVLVRTASLFLPAEAVRGTVRRPAGHDNAVPAGG